jgi:hypothetical protein
MENVLSIGAVVDLTALQGGMGQAQTVVANAANEMKTSFAGVGASSQEAAVQVQGAAEKMSFSMAEAKGSMALISEEIGVKIPRHIRGFIAELPGVGAAMSAAFSAVAIIALIEVVIKITEKIDAWGSAAEKARLEWEKQTETLHDHNDVLALTNAKLQEAIDKLEHKPVNYAAIALAEATVRADELAKALNTDIDEFEKLLDAQTNSKWEKAWDAISGNASASDFKASIDARLENIKKLNEAQKDLVRSNAPLAEQTENLSFINAVYADSIKGVQDAIKKSQDIEATHKAFDATPYEQRTLAMRQQDAAYADQTKLIAIQTAALGRLKDQQDSVTLSATNMSKEREKATAQENADAETAAKKLAAEQLKAYNEQQKEFAALDKAVAEFHKKKLAAEQKALKDKEQLDKEELDADNAVIHMTLKALEQAQQDKYNIAKADLDFNKQQIDSAYQLGLISEKQKIVDLKKNLDSEHALELADLNFKLELMKRDPDKSPQLIQQLQNQIAAINQKYRLQSQQLDNQALLDRKKKYDAFFKAIDSGFTGTLQGMIQGTQSFSKGMANMFNNIVLSFAQSLEHMMVMWIEHLLMKVILHKAAEKETTRSTTTETAKKAAMHAYDALVGIPIVGPILAPIGAAVAFAGIEALGSASQGALVPDDMLMQVHKKEMILPEHISTPLQSALAVGAFGRSSGGDTHIHANVTFQTSAVDCDSMKKHFVTHKHIYQDMVVKAVEKGVRNGHFTGKSQ